jgi:hypothetical protein
MEGVEQVPSPAPGDIVHAGAENSVSRALLQPIAKPFETGEIIFLWFVRHGSIKPMGITVDWQRAPCYDVASDRKRDGAKRHDTFSSDAGHVPEGSCVTRLLAAGLGA